MSQKTWFPFTLLRKKGSSSCAKIVTTPSIAYSENNGPIK